MGLFLLEFTDILQFRKREYGNFIQENNMRTTKNNKITKFNHFTVALLFLNLLVQSTLAVQADASPDNVFSYLGYKHNVTEKVEKLTEQLVEGVPFLQKKIWTPNKEGDSITIDTSGVNANVLYVLGCVYSVDRQYGNWGGTDGTKNYFIGNHGGDIIITYQSGIKDTIPLVFGYTLWWRTSYNGAPEPFRSDTAIRKLVDSSLCVLNGLEGQDKPYTLRIALRDEPVKSITFVDDPAKEGHPAIDGITFEKVHDHEGVDHSRFEVFKNADVPVLTEWMAEHTIKSSDAFPDCRKEALEKLMSLLYTRPKDINIDTISSVKPDVTASNFSGPKVKFSGSATAELMTHIYYENSQQVLQRVGEDGSVHESGAGADNYMGFGGYVPGLQAYYDDAYTRLRALTLLSNMGFLEKTEKAIDFFDKWLMYFPQSYPDLQLGGKPVPGHATVVANKPHWYFDTLRGLGWPTKYETRDFGNPEPDGHGMLMLTRWRSWVKRGRPQEWVKKHWEALNEAAEFIPWSLDNPELSFSEHGLLYGETEGGMQKESLFNNFPCYLGLLCYAEMAQSVGETAKSKRWQEQAQRLFVAMEQYFPTKTDEWGDIWNLEHESGFGPVSTLTPVIMGMDLWGYDVVNYLPKGWFDRTKRCYPMVLSHNKPRYCNSWALGYGQSLITEAALLFDEMKDASKMVDWIARYCFAPRQKNPYRVPESSVMDVNAAMWGRRGDLGNLFQLGEVVYTTHVIIGIDDLEEQKLKLMPRMPLGWNQIKISDWPVRVTSKGKSILSNMSYNLKMSKEKGQLEMDVQFDKPVDHLKIRLGPFPAHTEQVEISIDQAEKLTKNLQKQGDSKWCWIELKNCSRSNIKANSVVASKKN